MPRAHRVSIFYESYLEKVRVTVPVLGPPELLWMIKLVEL